MRVSFCRDAKGLLGAESSEVAFHPLAGLLVSDVAHEDDAIRLLEMLRGAGGRRDGFESTGNAFAVEAKSGGAVVSFAIDDSMRPVRLSTASLISLVEAWLGFLRRGAPDHWTMPDGPRRGATVHDGSN